MKKLIPYILLVSVFCLWTSIEAGQIYEWIDQNGVRHFTNEPPPPGAKIVNEQSAIQSSEAADQSSPQEDQEVQVQDGDQDLDQQELQTDQQPESQQQTMEEQTGYSGSDSNSDDADGGVIVDPYVRRPEQIRRYERRRDEDEDEEVVTPLPRRNRVRERVR